MCSCKGSETEHVIFVSIATMKETNERAYLQLMVKRSCAGPVGSFCLLLGVCSIRFRVSWSFRGKAKADGQKTRQAGVWR